MAKAIRAHNLGAGVTIALVAGLLVLVGLAFAVRQAVTTGELDLRATSAQGSGIANDPFIGRHAEVVATYRGVVPDASSITKDPYIDRHAAVVARYQHEGSR
jgi:hypothetical protein